MRDDEMISRVLRCSRRREHAVPARYTQGRRLLFSEERGVLRADIEDPRQVAPNKGAAAAFSAVLNIINYHPCSLFAVY